MKVCSGKLKINSRVITIPVVLLTIRVENLYRAHVAKKLKSHCMITTEIKPACSLIDAAIRNIWTEYNQKLGELTDPVAIKVSACSIYLRASKSV